MGIPILVVEHGPPLDGFLGHFQRDVDRAGGVRGSRFNCQFERIQRIAGIAVRDIDQVGARLWIQ